MSLCCPYAKVLAGGEEIRLSNPLHAAALGLKTGPALFRD